MSSESTTSRRRIEVPQRKALLVMLTFVLVVAQLMGMSPWAQGTTQAFGATPGLTIGAGYHITDDTGNPYQIDPGAINGVIYVDTVDVNGGTFTIAPTAGATFEIAGIIYVASGQAVDIGLTIANVSSGLVFQCQAPDQGVVVAQGVVYQGLSYQLTAGDAAVCTYAGGGYSIAANVGDNVLVLEESR